MATFKYFSGTEEVSYYGAMKNAAFVERFPGVRGVRDGSFERFIGKTATGDIAPVTRIIEYKSNPSLHKCDGRCLHAKGRTCECSCGGKNHGAGA